MKFNGNSKGISTGYHVQTNGDGKHEIRWKPGRSTFWTIAAVVVPLLGLTWGASSLHGTLQSAVQDTVQRVKVLEDSCKVINKHIVDIQIENMEQQRANEEYLQKILKRLDPDNGDKVIRDIERKKQERIKETKEKLNPGEG